MRSSRKLRWGVDEWDGFGQMLRSARDRLAKLVQCFPDTAGLTAAHVDRLAEAHAAICCAMIEAERVLRRQHRSVAAQLLAFQRIHGETPHTTFGRSTARARRDAPPLSRPLWREIGWELLRIAEEFRNLTIAISMTNGVRREEVRAFLHAVRLIDVAREKVDSLAYAQHPDWADRRAVFFGDSPSTAGIAHTPRRRPARRK